LNNITIAKDYIVQAEERIYHAKNALKRGSYAYVVRQSQEATELALKASLRLIGIEPPKIHDVGAILKQHKHKYPQWFQQIILRLARISRKLRRERNHQCMVMKRAEFLHQHYSEKEAKDALKNASYVLNNVKKLFEEYLKE
jgi:HEPN domain-containing protein